MSVQTVTSVQTVASLLKWLATNAISWDIGRQSALGPKSLKIKHQAFPHDGSTGLKLPAPASLPVTDNHHGAGDRVQLDVAGRSENFLVDTGATYSVLTSYSRAFSSLSRPWLPSPILCN